MAKASLKLSNGTVVTLEGTTEEVKHLRELYGGEVQPAPKAAQMESLIIETYIHEGRHHEIQNDGVFFGLEKLIAHVRADRKLTLGRNTPKTMTEVKQLGDTAAHDRVYITSKPDIDDLLARYRRMQQDLLAACGIRRQSASTEWGG